MEKICAEFKMNDLGLLKYFLGIEVLQSRHGMVLSQRKPNISYAVSVVTQYMHKPQLSHWQALERILQYLKGALGRGFLYKNHGHFNIEGFLDVDWLEGECYNVGPTMVFELVRPTMRTWDTKKSPHPSNHKLRSQEAQAE
ncbi:uncharacterized mitochondrial protein AtMg00810-like [Aristolochia californica]|uniref:uncharacterized mitochondrial protein AtMg00810-like n=1 Tax=Aristolochia californica TaxID=171875 RepID=UPI0035DDDD33